MSINRRHQLQRYGYHHYVGDAAATQGAPLTQQQAASAATAAGGLGFVGGIFVGAAGMFALVAVLMNDDKRHFGR